MVVSPELMSFYSTVPLGLLVGAFRLRHPKLLSVAFISFTTWSPLTSATSFASLSSPFLLQLPPHLPTYCSPNCQALACLRGFALAALFAYSVLCPDLCLACPLSPMSNVFLQRPSLTSLPKAVPAYVFYFSFSALITTLNHTLLLPCWNMSSRRTCN